MRSLSSENRKTTPTGINGKLLGLTLHANHREIIEPKNPRRKIEEDVQLATNSGKVSDRSSVGAEARVGGAG